MRSRSVQGDSGAQQEFQRLSMEFRERFIKFNDVLETFQNRIIGFNRRSRVLLSVSAVFLGVSGAQGTFH